MKKSSLSPGLVTMPGGESGLPVDILPLARMNVLKNEANTKGK